MNWINFAIGFIAGMGTLFLILIIYTAHKVKQMKGMVKKWKKKLKNSMEE